MFRLVLLINLRIAGGLVLDPINYILNSVRRLGAAKLVNIVGDLRNHD